MAQKSLNYLRYAAAASTAAIVATAASAPASALTIQQILNQSSGIQVRFEDDNFENEINGTGNTAGVLEVGDRLRGVARFPTIEQLGGSFLEFDLDGVANQDLTAIFEVEVTSKTDAGGGLFNFAFGASSAFGTETGTSDAAIEFYGDSDFKTAGDFRTNDLATTEGFVTDGDLLWTLGFGADPDNFWVALNANDQLGVVNAGDPASVFGTFNFGLDVLVNNLSGEFLDSAVDVGVFDVNPGTGDSMVDFLGSGTINGGNMAQAYDVESDAQLTSFFVVSEPATLGLFGLGLIGIGAIARRKQPQT